MARAAAMIGAIHSGMADRYDISQKEALERIGFKEVWGLNMDTHARSEIIIPRGVFEDGAAHILGYRDKLEEKDTLQQNYGMMGRNERIQQVRDLVLLKSPVPMSASDLVDAQLPFRDQRVFVPKEYLWGNYSAMSGMMEAPLLIQPHGMTHLMFKDDLEATCKALEYSHRTSGEPKQYGESERLKELYLWRVERRKRELAIVEHLTEILK